MAESQAPGKRYNVNAYAPRGGLVLAADGQLYDLAALLGASAADSVSDKRYDISGYAPRSGLIVGADGRVYDLVTLLQGGGGGGSGGGLDIKPGDGLALGPDGTLSVLTTSDAEQDNTLPITSAGVYTQLGNIAVLLNTI